MGTIPDQLQPKASLAINSTATFAARNKDTEIRIVVERMVWPLGSRMLSGDDISKIQSPKRDPDHLPNERNFHVPKTLSSVRSNQLYNSFEKSKCRFFESIWLLEKKRPAAKRLYTKRHTSLKLLNILRRRTKRKRRKPRTTSSFSKLMPHELSSTSSCGAKNKGITPKMIKHISSLCASTIPLGGEFWITFWPTNHQLETLSYPFHSYINSSHAKAYLQKVSWTSIQSHPSRKIDQPPARIRMKASMQYKARKIRSTPPISQNTVAWWTRWLDGSKNRVEKNHRLFAVN